MHEEYFGFSEKPFSLTPDPKYLYRSASHANAFEVLQYAIRRREGFIVVTGDIGTGKTTLCRAVLEQLDRKTFTALVLNPFISEEDLLRLILQDFGVVSREEMRRGRLAGVSKQDLIDTLNEFLLSLLPLKAGALLIIDEAQNLPRQVLEQIRMLSNLETDTEKLLQIVLVGQLNLKDLLRSPELRQLDQRVSIRYELKPLTREETSAYVAHRLTIAGGSSLVSFAPRALDRIHQHSSGIPRLINVLCDRALHGGYSAQTNRITPQIVNAAAGGLELAAPQRLPLWMKQRAAAFAAGAALMAAVSVAGVYGVGALQARAGSANAAVTRTPDASDSAAVAAAVAVDMPIAQGTTGPAASVDSPRSGDRGVVLPPIPSAPAPGRYSVLVGSFRYEPEASSLLDQLRGLGYQARAIRVSSAERGAWHQVFVGPYRDLDRARRDEAQVRQLPGYADARLVTR